MMVKTVNCFASFSPCISNTSALYDENRCGKVCFRFSQCSYRDCAIAAALAILLSLVW